MSEQIYKIWVDEELPTALIQKGYERVKNMTLEKYAIQWGEIIAEMKKEIMLNVKGI